MTDLNSDSVSPGAEILDAPAVNSQPQMQPVATVQTNLPSRSTQQRVAPGSSTPVNYGERMERYLSLAQTEAVEALTQARNRGARIIADSTRQAAENLAKAQAEADALLAAARAEAQRITSEASEDAGEVRRAAELDAAAIRRAADQAADDRRRDTEAATHELHASAQDRARRLMEDARLEADRMKGLAQAALTEAEQLRDAGAADAKATREHADADAAAILVTARDKANSLLAETKAEGVRIQMEAERSTKDIIARRDQIADQLAALSRTIGFGAAPPIHPKPAAPGELTQGETIEPNATFDSQQDSVEAISFDEASQSQQ